ncbi:MAG: hypothetical protein KC561_03135, partial [Myxococcales bacterium]|nr:hypothetical protein [Myxococcales bacterium]
ITVTVDHQLPTNDVHAKVVEKVRAKQGLWEALKFWERPKVKELWVVLIEKAIAKLWGGGYVQLNSGGSSSRVFETVSGTSSDDLALPSAGDDATWTRIYDHLAANRPATAGTDALRIIDQLENATAVQILSSLVSADSAAITGVVSSAATIGDGGAAKSALKRLYDGLGFSTDSHKQLRRAIGQATGVYAWHAYSILEAHETAADPPAAPIRKLVMRNPWGAAIPGVAELAEGPVSDAGTFRIDFQQFLNYFGTAYLGMVGA